MKGGERAGGGRAGRREDASSVQRKIKQYQKYGVMVKETEDREVVGFETR